MPSTDDWLQDILYRACGSTAQSSDNACALQLGKNNHVREAYVLDIDEYDAIDVYDQRSPKATTDAGSGSSHRCQVMNGSSTTLMIPTLTNTEIYGLRVLMVGGVWVRKWRYGGRDHFLDVFLYLSSLLFFGSRPGINGVGTGFTTSGSQSMGGGVSPCTGSTERSP